MNVLSVGVHSNMHILSIDTSCDETAAAVTHDREVISNIIWSQASLHAEFGGVMPSLAKREHEARIDWVINKALGKKFSELKGIDYIAVTAGPGLAITLGVGIEKAKELSLKFSKPLIAINHLEGHLLSPLSTPCRPDNTNSASSAIKFPAFGLVVSGGNTLLVAIESPGKYKTLAATTDDALGEALDKAARMLGLGYPGGAVMEKLAKDIKVSEYNLPIPLIGQEKRRIFSYSGLKTAMYRLVEMLKVKNNGALDRIMIKSLSKAFQDSAFQHLTRVLRHTLKTDKNTETDLLVGGGVVANKELRKRLRSLGKEIGLKLHFPYTYKLTGDNAAMIGVAAYYKSLRKEFETDINSVDREANAKIDRQFVWK